MSLIHNQEIVKDYLNEAGNIFSFKVTDKDILIEKYNQLKQYNDIITLEIPGFVTGFSNKGNIFPKSSKFKYISIPRTLTNLSYMFYKTELTTLDLSGLDVSNVTNMTSMFDLANITTIGDISEWDVSKVEDMSFMFRKSKICYLGEITDWNTCRVTSFKYMFSNTAFVYVGDYEKLLGVDKKKKIKADFPSYKTNAIERIMSDYNNGVFDFSYMLEGDSILLRKCLTTSKSETLVIPNFVDGFAEVGNIFSNKNKSVKKVILEERTSPIDLSFMFKNSTLEEIDLSELDTSYANSFRYMFNCSSLKSIGNINWNTSNVTDMSFMFENSKITTIPNIQLWDVSNVVSMNDMFASSQVTGVDLSNWDVKNVVSMSFMFCNSAIESLDLSKWNTKSLEKFQGFCSDLEGFIGSYTYSKIKSLGDLSNWDFSKVKAHHSSLSGKYLEYFGDLENTLLFSTKKKKDEVFSKIVPMYDVLHR